MTIKPVCWPTNYTAGEAARRLRRRGAGTGLPRSRAQNRAADSGGAERANLTPADIDGVAYTAGPGPVGALLVGATVGRALAFARNVPAVPVHHMEGHLLAPMLEDNPPAFPFVALLVSGGHTQLISVTGIGEYELLGESIDDAAGEAFDKTAKLLGTDYPGGPMLSKMAQQGTEGRFTFPRPMTDRPGTDFSFSGLKTFAANTIRSNGNDDQTRADIAPRLRGCGGGYAGNQMQTRVGADRF